MKTKYKKSTKRGLNKTHKRIRRGGLLQYKKTDLVNRHLCDINPHIQRYRESPAYEIYTAVDTAFELNLDTSGFFIQQFKKTNGKWFKFVVFQNDDVRYIYVINGAKINKHTVCLFTGILETTREKNEYLNVRNAYNILMKTKYKDGIDPTNVEGHDAVKILNTIINTNLPCLPVISAGSGTIQPDGSICINNKSGHYKPTVDSLKIAKTIFEEKTERKVEIQDKLTEENLHQIYGKDKAEEMNGMCL